MQSRLTDDGERRDDALFPIRNRMTVSQDNRETLAETYRQMVLIRRFEESVGEMYTRAKIGGYTHLNVGEEAAIVGALAALEPQDYVFTSYRDHGPALTRGVDPRAIMAELFGRDTGCARGRGGSMHLIDVNRRFMGGYAIVGSWLALAVGVATAVEYRQSGEIVLCAFGEGATNIGGFHESLNLAALWNLPLVFYCVNNQYAMGATVAQDSAISNVYQKACAYGIEAVDVDGMDVIAVHHEVSRMVNLTRTERRPTFVEASCYRFRGHSMADPARYRSPDELRSWAARDPIPAFRRDLEKAEVLCGDDLDGIDREVARIVADAVDFADSSPYPDTSDLLKYVYADSATVGDAVD